MWAVSQSDRRVLFDYVSRTECLSVTRSTRLSSRRDTGCTVIRKWNRTECAVLIWLKNTALSGCKKKIDVSFKQLKGGSYDMGGGVCVCGGSRTKTKKRRVNLVVRVKLDSDECSVTKIRPSNIMLFVSVLGITCVWVISCVIPFVPELLPPGATVTYAYVLQTIPNKEFAWWRGATSTFNLFSPNSDRVKWCLQISCYDESFKCMQHQSEGEHWKL